MGVRSASRVVAIAVCALALAAVPALAAISGPSTITPGKKAAFKVTGLPSASTLSVKLTTKGGGGVALRKHFSANQAGKANVNFNVPTKYNVDLTCNSAYAECPTKKWTDGQKVKLKVCPKGRACQARGLKIKK